MVLTITPPIGSMTVHERLRDLIDVEIQMETYTT